MNLKITSIFLVVLLGCVSKERTGFSLEGFTNELSDGTQVYLTDAFTEEIIDSTIVIENHFYLSGEHTEGTFHAALFTKPFTQFREVWIEPKDMVLDASQANFSDAKIMGSTTEELSQTLQRKLSDTESIQKISVIRDFISSNSENILGAQLLSANMIGLGKVKSQELFDNFSYENKNSIYTESILRFLDVNRTVEIGSHYVDFEMKDVQGTPMKLSRIESKYTLLEFWASWCAPCRVQNPDLVKLYEEFHEVGFEIVGVSMDTHKNQWERAIKQDALPWIQLSDLKGNFNEAYLIYGVHEIPDNFLIDENGLIIARNITPEKLRKQLLEFQF